MRVALCHEWVTTYGGSEQVAQRLAEALEASDVYTFTAEEELATELFPGRRLHVSRLGRTALARRRWQWFLGLMPGAWRRFDLSGYDLVVTSSHAAVNAIRVPEGVPHVSYCHTPMRYAWRWRTEISRFPAPVRPFWPAIAALLRRADRRWAQRVTRYVANSRNVASRIRSSYGREADVVHPPVDTAFWTPGGERAGHFLVAGRLVPYKRPEVAVRAAAIAGVPLVVAGAGPEWDALRRLAGPGVEFHDEPPRERLRDLYRSARALVFPGDEDFGMTMVEAQACGTPVIALGRGGALEAVVDGETGRLYEEDSAEGLAEAMRAFAPDDYDPAALRAHAERFGVARFAREMRRIVGEVVSGGA